MRKTISISYKSSQNYGWVLLFIVALLQALSALFLWISSGPTSFEADTGVAWAEFSRTFPSVAMQYSVTQRSSLVASLAIGLFSLAIIFFPFRDARGWAWGAMWILPASMVPGIVSLAQTENQGGIAVLGAAFVLVAVAGLLLSFRAFFPKQV